MRYARKKHQVHALIWRLGNGLPAKPKKKAKNDERKPNKLSEALSGSR